MNTHEIPVTEYILFAELMEAIENAIYDTRNADRAACTRWRREREALDAIIHSRYPGLVI